MTKGRWAIETHQYRTPSERDPDAFSVGVLNLTRREGEIIADFARQLQRIRDSDQKFDRVVVPIKGPLFFEDLQFVPTEPALTTKPKPAPATKPAPMGGRFSGIDFGE